MSRSSTDARQRCVLWTAVLAQGLLAVYLQFIEWVSVPPWNDLSRGNGQPMLDLVLGVLSVGFIVGTIRRSRAAIRAACMSLAVWLYLQVQTWWIPYVTGGSVGWRRVYAKWFAQNYRFLPDWSDHPVPDGAHTILSLLILVALVTTWRAALIPPSAIPQEATRRGAGVQDSVI